MSRRIEENKYIHNRRGGEDVRGELKGIIMGKNHEILKNGGIKEINVHMSPEQNLGLYKSTKEVKHTVGNVSSH